MQLRDSRCLAMTASCRDGLEGWLATAGHFSRGCFVTLGKGRALGADDARRRLNFTAEMTANPECRISNVTLFLLYWLYLP